MSVTAKELARLLGLSEASVSFALNNKPGVSPMTRRLVLEKALEMGYDFSRSGVRQARASGTACLLVYRRNGALVRDTPFFSAMTGGVIAGCKRGGYDVAVRHVDGDDSLDGQLRRLRQESFAGIVLLATEMDRMTLQPFLSLEQPLLALDARFDGAPVDCVSADNEQGAFLAADYLLAGRRKRLEGSFTVARTQLRPGYLRSACRTANFDARSAGFYRALRENGLSGAVCAVHPMAPTREGAYADMKELLRAGAPLADGYFADSDEIAAGAMDALREAGIAVPQDVGVVGFGDLPLCSALTPPLSSVSVPSQYMGETAGLRLTQRIRGMGDPPVKIEVGVSLVKRQSV